MKSMRPNYEDGFRSVWKQNEARYSSLWESSETGNAQGFLMGSFFNLWADFEQFLCCKWFFLCSKRCTTFFGNKHLFLLFTDETGRQNLPRRDGTRRRSRGLLWEKVSGWVWGRWRQEKKKKKGRDEISADAKLPELMSLMRPRCFSISLISTADLLLRSASEVEISANAR